jgi:hypothetical protein
MAEESDILGLLLKDDYFSINEELIIDELLDLFIAASHTTASAT